MFDSEAHLNAGGGRVRGAGVLTPSRDLRHGTAPIVDLYKGLRARGSGVKSPNVLLGQFSIRQGIYRKGYIKANTGPHQPAQVMQMP